MFCHICGNKFYDTGKFCHKCGTARLGGATPSAMPPAASASIIGNWELTSTNETNMAALLAEGKTVVTQYFSNGTAMMYVVDKAIAQGGQGNLYHQQAFNWSFAAGTNVLSVQADGQEEKASFDVTPTTLTLHGDGYYTTEQRLANDFEIAILDDEDKGDGGITGRVIGGIFKGVIEGLLE